MGNKTLSQARKDTDTGIQGFAPREILSVGAETKDTSQWLAFCFPEDDVTYQINGTGNTATLPAGTIRVVDESVLTIAFTGITGAKCEVM